MAFPPRNNHEGPGVQIYYCRLGDDVKGIIESIADSSIAKPYVVYLGAGVYSIGNNTITIPAYVTVESLGGDVLLDYTGNTTQTAVIMSSGSKLKGVAIQNHLSSAYAIDIVAAGSYIIDDVTFLDVSRCILVNHASARPTIRRPVFLPSGNAMVVGIKVENGNATVYEVRTGGILAITDLVWVTGATSHVHLFGLFSEVPGVVNALRSSASATFEAGEVIIKNTDKALYVESAATLVLRAGVMNENIYGMDITGSGSVFQGFNVTFLDNTTANYKADAGTTSVGFGISDPDFFDIDPDATLQANFLTTTPGDEALAVVAELHVGTPTFPRESCFGAGDSYVNGMLVYTYDDGLTTFTDETAAAKSVSSSPFTMGKDVNDALYCGSMVPISAADYHRFFGIKFLTTVAAVLGAGAMTPEYYTGETGSITAFADATAGQVTVTSAAHGLSNGDVVTISGTTSYNGTFEITNVTTNTFEITDTWVADDATGTWGDTWANLNHMTVQSNNKYYRQDGKLFEVTAGSYQVTFDPRMDADWAKTDPMTLGTDYYWVRFRVRVATITTAPTFEQIKLHTDRTELNADGYREMFGKARSYIGLPVFWNSFQDSVDSLLNQDLYRTLNCNAGFTNNVFSSSDSIGSAFPLPRWVDTSAPLKVEVVVVPDAAVNGDLKMTARLASSKDGDTVQDTSAGLTATSEVTDEVTETLVAEQQKTFTFELDISGIGQEGVGVSAEIIWLNIEADASVFPGTVYGITFLVKCLQFRDGEHL